MPTFVTYLEVSLNPKSAPPSEIVTSLKGLGWSPVFGQYDFAYIWEGQWNHGNDNHPNPPSPNGPNPGTPNPNPPPPNPGNGNHNGGFWSHVNKTHEILQRLNVTWSFRTFEKGRENFYVRWSE